MTNQSFTSFGFAEVARRFLPRAPMSDVIALRAPNRDPDRAQDSPDAETRPRPIPVPNPSHQPETAPGPSALGLGETLVAMGMLSPADLQTARAAQAGTALRLGDILLARNMIPRGALFRALARVYGTTLVDLDREPPDPRLVDQIGAEICLRQGFIPWKRVGNTTIIACAYPDRFTRIAAQLPAAFGQPRMVIAPLEDIRGLLVQQRHRNLAERAETRVADDMACRTWDSVSATRLWLILFGLVAALFMFNPIAGWGVLTAWAVLTLIVNSGVRLIATILHSRPLPDAPRDDTHPHYPARRPIVTVLVPLYREREIAGRLVQRLGRLTYPRELLDICLVVEEDDTLTHKTLARSDLPPWMRQITVPRGGVQTKPRALNYALDFARGSIIGVYDAEDAPAPDQIDRVAARFAQARPDVACLQGKLDFYNARTNWLSRCFTVEYATWFRIVLPGMSRMGFAIPLGGTTLFFRRAALEELGGWDAHNVTEDADLGMRLARKGYRTELIDTVTQEEANCRVWPWIKQRSRWIKGYAMTYGVHMRDPVKLWRELGPRQFLGFQIVFLGSLSHLVLAPVLWSYWLLPFGFDHPLASAMPQWMAWAMFLTFIVAEAITIAIGMRAVTTSGRKFLRIWVPTLHFYYPLASIAAMKGLGEIVKKPFYWDKTQHGHDDLAEEALLAFAAPLEPALEPAVVPAETRPSAEIIPFGNRP